MRFYPTGDISHYWEFPSTWTLYCREPHKTWYRRPLQSKHSIAHWRDLKGAKMSLIKKKDLYIKDWPRERIRREGCLPSYYCVGHRFIILEKDFPAGFKCTPFPMNYKEISELIMYDKELAKNKELEEKREKKLQKKREAEHRKKNRYLK